MWAVKGPPGSGPAAAQARAAPPAVNDASRHRGQASPRRRRRAAATP
ncbi:hypothetical protein SGRIM128S_03621 [Streptomyces griseomycini]